MSKSTTPATPKPERGRFPRSARLRDGRDFASVREGGKSAQGRLLKLAVFCPSCAGETKTGIITSKRVGGAVVRNKVRRRLRELVRFHRPDFPPGRLIVVIARPSAAGAAFEELRAEWLLLARRLSILPPLS
ncbi:MAG: ribonuclease P protein component [Verrucomicrobiae bacterium]